MFNLIRLYAYIHELFHDYLKFNIPGLGFLYRRLKTDRILKVKGKYLYFNHNISDNYGRLINGRFNEKETHNFLNFVFSYPQEYHFVDIGGNVGEFVLDYSNHLNVLEVTVFEPQVQQYLAIEQTIKLNNFNNVKLIKLPVSNTEDFVYFNYNTTNSTASGITSDENIGKKIKATTIDYVFKDSLNYNLKFVFLIDTEGAELNILKGGKNFIDKNLPLIIFEYNHITRQHFNIQDVELLLGKNYKIYKLRSDGKLDENFNKTWNLVALPNNYFDHVKSIIL